jgi:N-acetylglucosaminyldiphosphoundecaprenol N-acetyl-beta-D-mannosaminyltransferase
MRITVLGAGAMGSLFSGYLSLNNEVTVVDVNQAMVDAINAANPDLMWIGMTAPKQEKWTFSHWKEMNIHCHVGTVGAVFDFFAGTVKRAPNWMQNSGLEWLFRLIQQPKRMWRRYLIGNVEYIYNIIKYE